MNSCINLPSPLYTTNNTILQYIVYETDSTIAIQNFNIWKLFSKIWFVYRKVFIVAIVSSFYSTSPKT